MSWYNMKLSEVFLILFFLIFNTVQLSQLLVVVAALGTCNLRDQESPSALRVRRSVVKIYLCH